MKKNTIWNIIAAGVNALETVIIIAVVSRVHSVQLAGVFTIAFSLANLFSMIGKFGVRNYQIANEGYAHSRTVFLVQRIITATIMLVVGVGYLLIRLAAGGYDISKCAIILGVILFYVVEAVEDCYIGSFQVIGELHIGCKIFIIRWVAIFVCFITIDILFMAPVMAVWLSLLVSIIVEMICILACRNRLNRLDKTSLSSKLLVLFKVTFSLFVATFFYFFMTNISKYVIDILLNDEVQGVYGYIAMPVYVIAILNQMIYLPQLTYYVEEYRNRDIKALIKRIRKQMIFIFVVLLCCIAGAYFLGIWILKVIFGVQLQQYHTQMMLLLIGGFFLAMGGYLAALIVVFDRRMTNLILTLISAAFGSVITYVLTKLFLLNGVVIGYLITMFFFALSFFIALVNVISSIKRDNQITELER